MSNWNALKISCLVVANLLLMWYISAKSFEAGVHYATNPQDYEIQDINY